MKKQDVDEVLRACQDWVQQHHRTELTPAESQEIRRKLMNRLERKTHEEPTTIDLVRIAHAKANDLVSQRRDRALVAEHRRII